MFITDDKPMLKIYINLRKILRIILFLVFSKNSKIINYFIRIDLFLRKKKIFKMNLNGRFKFMNTIFYYDKVKDTSIASSILTNGYYEKETFEEIKKNLSKGSVFIDGGANIGFFSILTSKLVGSSGKVICFEPTDSCYAYLLKNIKINRRKNIYLEKKAISSQNGTVQFKINENSEENSIVSNFNKKKFLQNNIIKIKSTTIDSYCKKNKISQVDLIKLDIEGQEYEAIKGSSKIIKKNRNIKIIFELNIANRKNGITYSKKIFKLLKKLNFNYYKLLLNPAITIRDLEDKKNIELIKKITTRHNVNILAYK